jgi:outer membrane protein OmpA-like peptidoglycan-associated protein
MLNKSRVSKGAGHTAVVGSWAVFVLLACPTAAYATDFSFKLEPGVAIPLSAPQSQRYGVGGDQSLKALFRLTPYLDIGPNASFVLLPASAPLAESGVVWGLGAGLRLKRPHDAESGDGISPWLDADLLYVRTGELDRPGFDVAVGLSVPVGEARTFWVGPFVRYLQIIQHDRDGFDDRDAKILSLGVSFEVGSGIERRRPREDITRVPEDTKIVAQACPDSCPDRDHDGVPDSVDTCPDVAGEVKNWGCPSYDKLVVEPDKVELKEKLYFAWDQATLEERSFPVLDEVAKALNDNQGFHVQIEGHADASGALDYNQTLSEKRADAVLDYLVAHGVSKSRLVAKGFSSSVPNDTDKTVAGRENNRRVEFVVNFVILNAGNAK